MIMEAKNITCGYGKKVILENISFSLSSGESMLLLGPNGVGKTTLFRTILGLLPLLDGEVMIDGKNRKNFSVRELAQYIAYVPQAHTSPYPFSAQEVVALGRAAHLGTFSSPKQVDMEIAREAMEQLGIINLKDSLYTQISGGERQMVLVARALAQKPKFLILDEPTSNLDFGNQVQVLKKVNELRKTGLGIIMTTHNPDHTFMCATKLLLITKNGEVRSGTAQELITRENMREAYGIDTCIGVLQTENGKTIDTCVPVI